MTSQEIRQLVPVLPAVSPYPAGFTGGARIQHCLNDPEFAWNFLMTFITLGKRLPVQARTPTLIRAYRWRARGATDPVMDEVHGLTHPALADTADLLRALLITDMPMERIAELLSLPLEVVQMFEALHWAVRDRMAEQAYIGRLVFPRGRLAVMDGAMPPAGAGQRLLQAAFEHGAEEVLFLAGLSRRDDRDDSSHLCDQLETEILQNGVRLARHGYVNRRDVPALKRAQALLLAQKRGAAQPPQDNGAALALSISDTMAEELNQIAGEEFARQKDILCQQAKEGQTAS